MFIICLLFIVNYDDDSISSTDEVVSSLKDQNSIYKAQLQEIQGRLVKARQEGQEAAENKTVGEIQSLHTQLGAKSKCVNKLCYVCYCYCYYCCS